MAIKLISLSLMTFITLCCTLEPALATPIFGTNLIINGNAEAGSGSDLEPDTEVVPVPGWQTEGNFNVLLYDIPEFLASTDPGPPDRGNNYFYGGEDMASSRASQSIDVTVGATIIDAGGVTFDLTGWLGGYESQPDYTVLTAIFKDASNAILGTTFIGPVTAEDRNNVTGLWLRTTSGNLPANTREIEVLLQMTRFRGNGNDGYADNLSLVLQTIPEPGILTLLGIGLINLIAFRWLKGQEGKSDRFILF